MKQQQLIEGKWIDAVRGQANVPFAMRAQGDALDSWVAAAARVLDHPRTRAAFARTADRVQGHDPDEGHPPTPSVIARSTFAFARRTPQ